MEYLKKFETLSYVIKEKVELSKTTRRSIAFTLIDAVSMLHNDGIAHCDLKPLNIMVDDATVKIIDFGIACTRDTCVKRAPQGTYIYMPPEWLAIFRFSDSKPTSSTKRMSFEECVKADIWATGLCILWLCQFPYTNAVIDLLYHAKRADYRSILLSNRGLIEQANRAIQNFLKRPSSNLLAWESAHRHF
jgi:serine/threonine protein kinase